MTGKNRSLSKSKKSSIPRSSNHKSSKSKSASKKKMMISLNTSTINKYSDYKQPHSIINEINNYTPIRNSPSRSPAKKSPTKSILTRRGSAKHIANEVIEYKAPSMIHE